MKKFTRIEPTTAHVVGGQYKREIVVKRFRTEDGVVHEFTTFGREGGHHGAVIAITDDGKVVTTYQFRSGPERWLYELPGGGFHDGEDLSLAVQRELKEETGYVPGHLEYLGDSLHDTYTNGTWHYFFATGCKLSKGGPNKDKEELEQGAEVRLISIDELITNAKHNRMGDPQAVLMAYDRLLELKGREK